MTKEIDGIFRQHSRSKASSNNNQFFNLNLNHTHQCSDHLSPAQFYSKLKNKQICGHTVTDNYQENEKTWNKSSKNLCLNTTKSLFENVKIEEKQGNQKRWKNDKIDISNQKYSSTLSLHISAYEISFDVAAISSNELGTDLSKKFKAFKSVYSLSKFQDPFEFPRQMEAIEPAAPEIQQFKASQKLIAPNQEQQKCCSCHQVNTWRLLLRNCSHSICIFCGIEYLRQWIQEKDKARIKCPKKSCSIRIHENDVKALLDSENRALDIFMPQAQREWLQFKHDKDGIGYALGAPKFARQCPLCKNFYAKIDGCNFVRCSNLRCNQWFCFCCGDPVQSWQHFSQGGQCRVSWDDVYKLTYLLRFIVFSDPFTNFLLIPFAWLAIWIFLPLFVLIGFPFCTLREILKMQNAIAIPVAILASPFIFATSIILFFGTFLTAFPMYFFYVIISVIKCIPPATHIFRVMDYAAKFAGIFGFGDWKQILMDSRDARIELEIEEMQSQVEKSERIPTIERNEQQQLEFEAAELAKEARKNRAIGAAQCSGGAVDVGRLIKKGAHNVEVIQKGELQNIKLVGFNDVKVNDAQAVAENIKIKGKPGKAMKLAAIV